MAEDDDAVGRNTALFAQVAVCGIGVAIESMLAGCAAALAISAVIEGKQIQAELAETGVMRRTVELREVPGVAVADQQPKSGCVGGRRHDPTHQLHTVCCGELNA